LKGYNWTPLHFAAQTGNLEICKFLSENLQHTNANPRTNTGITPLHLAAKNGHLEIYKFICETVWRKNPVMDKGITPLHLAAKHNQIDVCKFICENVHNVSPKIGANDLLPSLTPLTFAINRGNVKVSKLIIKYDYQVCSKLNFFGIHIFRVSLFLHTFYSSFLDCHCHCLC
jgi:ankyrin repeat protein